MSDDPAVEAWIDQARSASILEVSAMAGAALRKSGNNYVGPCPRCGGDDRFVISPQQVPQKQFLCRPSNKGGDVISMIEHVREVPFMAACEIINGCPAPQRQSTVQPVDPEVERARQDARRDAELLRAEQAKAEVAKKACSASAFFDDCKTILGTHGEAYYRLRGIPLYGDVVDDLRFHPAIKYKADDGELVGRFPAVVAAIRTPERRLIGAHITYLDPDEPIKLTEPHVPKGSVQKKVWGNQVGGAIYLGAVRPVMAIGEGIETTIAWSLLDHGSLYFGIACAINLGNLAGGSTGTIRAADGSSIPNGTPDMGKPGIRLPAEVEEIILLGDRDLRMANVERHLLTAARRFRAEGKAVSVRWPEMIGGRKTDFADVLLASAKRAA
jgi:hypothetical protein